VKTNVASQKNPAGKEGYQNVPRSGNDTGPMPPPFIRPFFVRMGIVERRKPDITNRHQHTGYEIIFADRGIYHCLHNDMPVTLGPHDVLVIKPGDWHVDQFDGRFVRFFAINFRLQTADGATLSIFKDGTPSRRQHFKIKRGEFLPILRKLAKEQAVTDFVSAHIQDTLTLEFFYRMVRAVPGSILSDVFVQTSRDTSFTTTLLALLHARLTRNLHVGELAKMMNMSESSLAHRTREVMKCSPAHLFTQLRMERAKNLLASTDMSVKDVSNYLGFADPFYFSRAFKRAFGYPPSDVKDAKNAKIS
jgi:AraC-like DNA-binding protein